ncbi:uroporphyrinogen-III synthase [Cerasibacillus sp. JNUCC 74]
MELPFKGQRILITREKNKAAVFAEKIRSLGGEPIQIPLLTIACKDTKDTFYYLKGVKDYSWIFFTSANGVDCFFRLAEHYHIGLNWIRNVKIAVVGKKTANALAKWINDEVDFIPTCFNADTMATEFLQAYPLADNLLLIRGNRSRDVLPKCFTKANKTFASLEVYETHINRHMEPLLKTAIGNSIIDYITFTSPSTVEAFAEMTPIRNKAPCVCIGTTTEQRARELGFCPVLTSSEFTIDGMIQCMLKDLKQKGR